MTEFTPAQEIEFKADLVALIPKMRAFARGLCHDATFADDLAQDADKGLEQHLERLEQIKFLSGQSGVGEDGAEAVAAEEEYAIPTAKEPIFNKGQSKRIWNELYKVIDSSGKHTPPTPWVYETSLLTRLQMSFYMSSTQEIR